MERGGREGRERRCILTFRRHSEKTGFGLQNTCSGYSVNKQRLQRSTRGAFKYFVVRNSPPPLLQPLKNPTQSSLHLNSTSAYRIRRRWLTVMKRRGGGTKMSHKIIIIKKIYTSWSLFHHSTDNLTTTPQAATPPHTLTVGCWQKKSPPRKAAFQKKALQNQN